MTRVHSWFKFPTEQSVVLWIRGFILAVLTVPSVSTQVFTQILLLNEKHVPTVRVSVLIEHVGRTGVAESLRSKAAITAYQDNRVLLCCSEYIFFHGCRHVHYNLGDRCSGGSQTHDVCRGGGVEVGCDRSARYGRRGQLKVEHFFNEAGHRFVQHFIFGRRGITGRRWRR